MVHGLETLDRVNDELMQLGNTEQLNLDEQPNLEPVLHHLMYVGGKFDNHVERRKELPKLGEPVYRLFGRMYVKYVWNGSVFVFDSVEA